MKISVSASPVQTTRLILIYRFAEPGLRVSATKCTYYNITESIYDILHLNISEVQVVPRTWTKLNQEQNGVRWGAKGDQNGEWQVASKICGTKLMLQAISGGVACNGGSALSNFGCPGRSELYVYVTKGKGYDNVIVPHGKKKGNTYSGGSYLLSGYNSASPIVVFDLPLMNGKSEYCFENGTEYHLWHTEDMTDTSEHDNFGTAYTDIYIYQDGRQGILQYFTVFFVMFI